MAGRDDVACKCHDKDLRSLLFIDWQVVWYAIHSIVLEAYDSLS